jgi:hypothetical protein
MNDDRNHDELDDLDRALFALPLAEPPADLRDAILRATVYAPATSDAFGRIETIAIGLLLALGTWLAILCMSDASLVRGLEGMLGGFLSALTDPRIVIWLGLGAAVATVLTFGNVGSVSRFGIRNGRSS